MKKTSILISIIGIILIPLYAQAAPILAPGHTWEYTFVDPTADSTWNTATGGWTTGPAPFGNHTGPYGLVSSAGGEGYTYRWEYRGNFSGVSLNQGLNVIAVALADWGSLTAFDMVHNIEKIITYGMA